MNIINHLSNTITPAVLSDATASSETSMLEQFYAIFLARLADDNTYAKLLDENLVTENAGLDAIVWNNTDDPKYVAEQLAVNHGLEINSVQQMMAAASPLVVQEVEALAGETPVPTYLRGLQHSQDNHNTAFVDHIPNWALAMLPAGLLGGTTSTATAHVTPPAHVKPEPADSRISETISTDPLVKTKKPSGSFMKALLPIIGLIILGGLAWALLKGCQEPTTSTPVATTTEQSAQTVAPIEEMVNESPSVLRLSVDETGENVYTATVTVGDQGVVDSIKSAIINVFGQPAADKLMVDIDSNLATHMPAGDKLTDILSVVKGVPNASISIVGETIRINAPDTDARDKLVAQLQALLPAFIVEAEPDLNIGDSVNQSITASQAALNRLTAAPNINDLIRALNLQIINFAVDEAIIPEENKVILDKAAELLQKLPDAHLKITGHTDTQGPASYNQDLSERRAISVKEYLISKGVNAEHLTTIGAGQEEPIADNSTEQGRFRNRRIEFGVMSDGKSVAVIGNGESGSTSIADTTKVNDAIHVAGNAVKEVVSGVVDREVDLNSTDTNHATDNDNNNDTLSGGDDSNNSTTTP